MEDRAAVSALSVENVSVSYKDAAIIHDISFSVTAGQTFGLIGLNGTGKTTLIKAILGLRECNEGVVRIDGNPNTTPASRRRVAYLPERFDPPGFLKGYEFLKFSLALYRRPFSKEAVCAASEDLALGAAALEKKIQTYSKGMRQKLGLLATLLTGCPLLILDEPMSGLDPHARLLVKAALKKVRDEGRTVFLSSHILSDMNEICDNVVVMHQGRLVFSGAPAALAREGNSDNLEQAFLQVIGLAA